MIWKDSDLNKIFSGTEKNIFKQNEYYIIELDNIYNLEVIKLFCLDSITINTPCFLLSIDGNNFIKASIEKKHDTLNTIVFYLYKNTPVKFIKFLHYSNFIIDIYSRKYCGIFLSTWQGGWGDRIIPLLNAMYLAKHTKFKFGFIWNQLDNDFFNIEKENNIFSKHFINKYSYTNNCKDVILNDTFFSLKKTFNDYQKNPFDYYYGYNTNHYIFLKPKKFYQECKKLFNQIDFSKNIKKTIRTARLIFSKYIPKDITALHIRSGDIIYSKERFRYFLYYEKAMPFEIALELIKKIKTKNILLFGEDQDILNNLFNTNQNKSRKKIFFARDFIPHNINNKHIAIYEIILMSQCKNIYSTSGFARLASLIGNAREPNNWKNIFSEKQKYNIIKDNIAMNKNHPLQLSFSLFCLYTSAKKLKMNELYLINILEEAIKNDSNNMILYILKIQHLISIKKYAEAEITIKQIHQKENFKLTIKLWAEHLIVKNIYFNFSKYLYVCYFLSIYFKFKKNYIYYALYTSYLLQRNNQIDFSFLLNNKNKYIIKQYHIIRNELKNNLSYKIGSIIINNTSYLKIIYKIITITIFQNRKHKKSLIYNDKTIVFPYFQHTKEYYAIQVGNLLINIYLKLSLKVLVRNILKILKLKKELRGKNF
ncbi:hypothetical protein L8T90_02950 [Campylobacter sp. RKI_CA19_01121]|uniref:hypothetical protein n=1 Tax=Campylobacter sp. RKI_CA19_01121 TaxID=2911626 RepID=UPI0021E979E0|nr:hypothetical protein [Campylobacter sp. RKI_CA19_01121]MCV3336936.1 hypothetical protein [Campylobacter sp. RKI_CA19_01121]